MNVFDFYVLDIISGNVSLIGYDNTKDPTLNLIGNKIGNSFIIVLNQI